MYLALTSVADRCAITPLTDDGTPNAEPTGVARAGLAAVVARLEADHPRWV